MVKSKLFRKFTIHHSPFTIKIVYNFYYDNSAKRN